MKLFKFLSVGLLFVSLMGCNEEGEFDSSRGSTNEAEAATTVAPVVQSNSVDISALGEERVVSLKTSVADPQHLPVTLEQVVSLSKDCQDPTIIDPDDLTFSIDNRDPESCFYQYTVKNHSGDPALDKTAKGTTHTFLPAMKRLPPISEVTTVDESLIIDLESQLGEEYPDGYVLDEEVIVFIGSGVAIADTSTNSITFTSDVEGQNRVSYTLNDPNGTESEEGTIYIAVSLPGNGAPVALDFMGPQNVEPGELVYVDVASSISDPDDDELNLVDVDAFSATVDIIDNPNGNNTQFSFKADIPGVYNVRYTVSDNRGGEAGAFVTLVIPARTLLPWGDIFFNNVLVYAAPWEKEVADGENIGYTTTQEENVDGTDYDIALFDYDNAGFTCERYGMELPTEGQLLDLFNHFNSQGINIQDADGNAWPVSVNYVSSESNVSVNLFNGDVNDSESPDTPLMLTCAFPSLLQVTVTTDSAYVLENGETPESDNYNLVQAKVFNSSGLPDEGEMVFIKSTDPSLTFTQPNGITDDNGEFTFGVTSSVPGDFVVTVSYMEQNIPVLVTFLEDKVISLDISGPNEVLIGESIQLMAETTDSQGNVVDVTLGAMWSSDDVSIASVNAGSVFGVSLGETTVSADYAGVSASPMTITVIDSFGEDGYIEVTPERVDLDTGDNNTQDFSATLYSTAYPDGKDITSDPATTWQVTDGDGVVGSLNENVFTASGAGSATVEAQYEILETGEIASDTATVTVTEVEPTPDGYVEVTPNKVTLDTGANNTQAFSAMLYTTVNPEGVDITTDSKTQWQVIEGDGVVGSLDENVFTAIAEGNATVRAKYKIDKGVFVSDKAKVIVTESTVGDYVEVTPNKVTLDTGANNTQAFSAMLYTTANPEGVDITTDSNTLWQVIDGDGVVGSLDENVFTAIAEGNATVRAKYKIDKGEFLSDKAKVTVTEGSVSEERIEIRRVAGLPVTDTMTVGDTQNLEAILIYSDNTEKDVTDETTWSSVPEAVLTVDASGVAQAESEGDATVSAAYNLLTDSVNITVEAASGPVFEIEGPTEVVVNDFIRLVAKLDGEVQTNPPGSYTVIDWSSSNPEIASVDTGGYVTGEATGTVTITATLKDESIGVEPATYDVTVTPEPWGGDYMEIIPESATLDVGGSQAFTAKLYTEESPNGVEFTDAIWTLNEPNGDIGDLSGEDGNVFTATNAGSGSIMATLYTSPFDTITATADIIVEEAATTDYLEIEGENEVVVDEDITLELILHFSGGEVTLEDSAVEWSSSDESIATVDSEGLVSGIKEGTVIITGAFTNSGLEPATHEVTVTSEPWGGDYMEIIPESATLDVGDSQAFTAKIYSAEYPDGAETTRVAWTLNEPNGDIGDLSGEDGNVFTATNAGSGSIMATWYSGSSKVTETASIIVVGDSAPTLTSVEITNPIDSLKVDNTYQYEAVANYSDGSRVDITSNATWTANPNDIAKFSYEGAEPGVVTALKEGTTTLKVTYSEGGVTKDDTTPLEVTEGAAVVTSFEIRDEPATLEIGTTDNLTAWLVYSDGTSEEVTQEADWKSNNTKKLSVNNVYGSKGEIGTLDGASDGDLVTASATYEEWIDTTEKIELTEATATMTSLEIREAPESLAIGDTDNLEAWAVYDDGTSTKVTVQTDWVTKNPNRISVNNTTDKGLIEALGSPGYSATIEATYGELKDSVSITVTESSAVVTSFEIRDNPEVLPIADSTNLTAWVVYSNGTSTEVTDETEWESESSYQMTVNNTDNKGYITAFGPKYATGVINATYGQFTDSVEIDMTDDGGRIVTELRIDYNDLDASIKVGQTKLYQAIAYYNNDLNNYEEVTRDAVWSSSDPSVASFESSYSTLFPGEAIGVSPGVVRIDAEYTDENGVTESASTRAKLEVTPFTFPSVLLDVEIRGPDSMKVGSFESYTAWAIYAGNREEEVTLDSNWKGSPETVLSVSNDGMTKGLAEALAPSDSAFVIVNYKGDEYIKEITINNTDVSVTSFEIRDEPASLEIGTTDNLTAWLVYSDGSSEEVTQEADWKSNNTSKLSVDNVYGNKGEIGTLEGASDGDLVTANASYEGWSDTSEKIELTESAVTLTSVEITNAIDSLNVDKTYQYEAVANYSDGSRVDITNNATWRSSDSGVAKFSYEGAEPGVVTSLDVGNTTVSVTYQQDGVEKVDSAPLEVTTTPVTMTSFEIRDNPESLAIGVTDNLTAWVVYSDGTSTKVTDESEWGSKNPNRISVNNTNDKGLIEALGSPGYSATIEATYGEFKDSVSIKVTEGAAVVTGLEIREAPESLAVGDTDNLEAWAVYDDGTSTKVTDESEWQSLNTKRISVNNTDNKGFIEVLGSAGTYGDIKVSYGGLSDTVRIDIEADAPTVTSLEIRDEPATLEIGTSDNLTAWLVYSDGSSEEVTQEADWKSNNTSKLSVDNVYGSKGEIGTLNGASDGDLVTANASYEGLSDTSEKIELTEAAITLTSVEITNTAADGSDNIKVGDTYGYKAKAYYSNGTNRVITNNATWTSSDSSVAKFSYQGAEPGVVTGLDVGNTTVKVTYSEGGVTKEETTPLEVTEGAATVISFEIRDNPESLAIGETDNLTAWAVYSDGTSTEVTDESEWESLNAQRISVNNTDNKGLIEALGSAGYSGSIKATYGDNEFSDTVTILIDEAVVGSGLFPFNNETRVDSILSVKAFFITEEERKLVDPDKEPTIVSGEGTLNYNQANGEWNITSSVAGEVKVKMEYQGDSVTNTYTFFEATDVSLNFATVYSQSMNYNQSQIYTDANTRDNLCFVYDFSIGSSSCPGTGNSIIVISQDVRYTHDITFFNTTTAGQSDSIIEAPSGRYGTTIAGINKSTAYIYTTNYAQALKAQRGSLAYNMYDVRVSFQSSIGKVLAKPYEVENENIARVDSGYSVKCVGAGTTTVKWETNVGNIGSSTITCYN